MNEKRFLEAMQINLDDLISLADCLGNWEKRLLPDNCFDETYSACIDNRISLVFSAKKYRRLPPYYSLFVEEKADEIGEAKRFREFREFGGKMSGVYERLRKICPKGYWEGSFDKPANGEQSNRKDAVSIIYC